MDRVLKAYKERREYTLNALTIVFRETTYSVVAFTFAVIMAITYPLLFQLAVGAKKISLFAFRGDFLDIVLLTLISFLFGVTITMQGYIFRTMTREYKKTTRASLLSTITGVITAKACCLLPLLLFTIGATAWVSFFVKYATWIRFAGLVLLLWSFYWTARTIGTQRQCCVIEGTKTK